MIQFIIGGKVGSSILGAGFGNIGSILEKELGIESKTKKSKPAAARAVRDLIRRHWSSRFPGSKYYSPNKVNTIGDKVEVGVEGAVRAYHPVDIYPQNAAFLTIPVHPQAKGHRATEFDLFKPRGKDVLAQSDGAGGLIVFYALSKHVHQKQDPSIMPTDKQIEQAAGQVVAKQFD